MAPKFDKIQDWQVIDPIHIWLVAYVKEVTQGEIWKTTKFSLLNKKFSIAIKGGLKIIINILLLTNSWMKQIFQLKSKRIKNK